MQKIGAGTYIILAILSGVLAAVFFFASLIANADTTGSPSLPMLFIAIILAILCVFSSVRASAIQKAKSVKKEQ